ncbi:MAG: aminotransferase class I/II-fold pyridoxal phosphate-dependent enzyme, partial [Planctomycetota bacterium]
DAMPSNATLLIDDCHGVAAMGEGGRGVLTRAQIDPARVVLTTTLAKGVGAAGGVVVAPTDLIECARRHASAYVCTTPIAPALAMGAVAAIHAIDHEPWRLRRLQKLVHRLDEHCERLALTTPARRGAPIAAFTLGSGATMRRLHEELIAEQWLVPLIEYPNGPSERYFRLSVNADHTLDDLDQLFETIDAARRDASKE